MAQCVARNRLADTGITGRFPYQFVQVILIKVMTPQATTCRVDAQPGRREERSEEHTSELQSREDLVCRLLLEKKKEKRQRTRLTCAPRPCGKRVTQPN